MTLTPEEAKKIAIKIKALFDKTVDNGATEDEAFAAVMKARELMDKYSINFDALDMKAEGLKHEVINPLDSYTTKAALIMGLAIARYTETKIWKEDQIIHYLGLSSDVMFARWLNDTLCRFIERKAKVYVEQVRQHHIDLGARLAGAETRSVTSAFFIGTAQRISERLHELSAAREKLRGEIKGNDLVLVTKQSLIDEETARMGLNLKKRGGTHKAGNGAAYRAGLKAGEEATFNKPVNEKGQERIK